MTKRKHEALKEFYCPFCCIMRARVVTVPFFRNTRKCHVCGHSVKEMQTHEFNESERNAILNTLRKYKRFPNRNLKLLHTDYKLPEPLVEHLRQYEANKQFVFLSYLEMILNDPTEYEKFRRFVDSDRAGNKLSN